MRLFLDSASPEIWEKFKKLGWAYGATTNPLILKREGRLCNLDTYRQLVKEAKSLGLAELQVQATGPDAEALVKSGSSIAELWEKIVVKIPLTMAGLEAATRLRQKDLRITLTAAYASHQMIPAITLKTDYIAPYFGRLQEAGKDGFNILDVMRSMRDNAGVPTRILIASLRSVQQVEELAGMGHDTFTLAPAVAEQLAVTDLSDEAALQFEEAAK